MGAGWVLSREECTGVGQGKCRKKALARGLGNIRRSLYPTVKHCAWGSVPWACAEVCTTDLGYHSWQRRPENLGKDPTSLFCHQQKSARALEGRAPVLSSPAPRPSQKELPQLAVAPGRRTYANSPRAVSAKQI